MLDQATPTTPTATADRIIQIATGFMASKHLFVASGVGLFEALADGPTTLDHITERTGLPRPSARLLADAMVALGLLQKTSERYSNSELASTFLAGRTPADLRPFLRFWDRISYPAWQHLAEAARTRQPATPSLSPELGRVFSEGVQALTAPSAHALAETYDFSRHQRVLDLGGGTGSFLRTVLTAYPRVRGTLFETPPVAAIARQLLISTSVGDRVDIVAGDLFQDSYPPGHDAIIVANVVHLFSSENNRVLLRRIREHVPTGARLLLVDFWTDPSHTDPPFAALMAGEFLTVTGQGDVYSTDEVRGWLRDSGWYPVDVSPLAGPASLIIAEA